MAGLFDSLGFKCDECGDDGTNAQRYKVVEQRHLCPTCARNLAGAILADVSHEAIKWPCPQHERKEVELLCCKCNVALCQICALTIHRGHQMQEIAKFFAEKREIVKKYVDDISAKEKETRSFLDNIECTSQEINGHFKDIKEKVSVTFQAKSQDHKDRKSVQVSRINKEAEELIRQVNEKRQMKLAAINEKYDNEHDTLVKDRDDVLEQLKVIEDSVCRVNSDAQALAAATNAELQNAAKVAKSMITDDCDGKTFHARAAEFHEMGIEKLPCLDRDYLANLSKVAKSVRFNRARCEQRIGILTRKKDSNEMVKTVLAFLQISMSHFIYDP